MKVRLFHSEEQFNADCINIFNSCREQAGRTYKVALSGGSSPVDLYKKLSAAPNIPFENIEFFQVDERYVPADDPNSNQKMVRDTLLFNPNKQPTAFHYFDTTLPIEDALYNYEKQIENVVFDLCFLGVGLDFHTASLFPGSAGANEEKKLVAHTQTEDYEVKDRLTITFPQILKSKNILVLLKGLDKNEIEAALTKALAEPKKDVNKYPALRLLDHHNLTVFHLL